MKVQFPCRTIGCPEVFNHRQKRIRHEATHTLETPRLKNQQKKRQPKKPKKMHMCACCHPPRPFESAKARRNHKHYETHKHKFKCPNCRDTFATNQVMKEHHAGCSEMKKSMAAVRKLREQGKNGAESEVEEEDKHSSSDEDQDEYDEGCQECHREADWLCYYCSYGLCERHRRDSALAHLWECSKARKKVGKNTNSKRI